MAVLNRRWMKAQEDHKADLSFNQKVKSETGRGIESWQRKGQWNIAMARTLSHWLDRQADEVNEKTDNNEWLFSSPWVHVSSRLSAPILNAQTPQTLRFRVAIITSHNRANRTKCELDVPLLDANAAACALSRSSLAFRHGKRRIHLLESNDTNRSFLSGGKTT